METLVFVTGVFEDEAISNLLATSVTKATDGGEKN